MADSGFTTSMVRAGFGACAIAVGMAFLAACAWACSAPVSSSGSASDLTALLDRPSDSLLPGQPGAAVYQSEPASRRQFAALADPLRGQIFAQLRKLGAERNIRVVPDSRLDAAMNDLARSVAEGEQPRSEAVQFLLAHYGVVEPYPVIHFVTIARTAESLVAQELTRSFSPAAKDPLLSLGIGIDRATSLMTVMVAVQPKHIDLVPLPRSQPADSTVELSGRLLGRFRQPHLYVTYPSGRARRYPIAVRADEFRGRVKCDRGAGSYQIEVFGNDEFGPRVLANFPVYCGVDPPARYIGKVGYTPYRIPAAAAEARLFALVNRARTRAGLDALEIDPRLAQVARQHSADMQENGFVGHISPTTGQPGDRVKAAGIVLRRLLENVGTSGSAEEVHAGLMRSPGHRAAILDPRVTHVGIGVVLSPPQSETISLYATELFR